MNFINDVIAFTAMIADFVTLNGNNLRTLKQEIFSYKNSTYRTEIGKNA